MLPLHLVVRPRYRVVGHVLPDVGEGHVARRHRLGRVDLLLDLGRDARLGRKLLAVHFQRVADQVELLRGGINILLRLEQKKKSVINQESDRVNKFEPLAGLSCRGPWRSGGA